MNIWDKLKKPGVLPLKEDKAECIPEAPVVLTTGGTFFYDNIRNDFTYNNVRLIDIDGNEVTEYGKREEKSDGRIEFGPFQCGVTVDYMLVDIPGIADDWKVDLGQRFYMKKGDCFTAPTLHYWE